MTLNDPEWPFCVKICFGLSNYWVGVSGFRTKLFENLQSYPYTVSDKNVAQGILSGVRKGCAEAPDLFLVPMDWLMEHTTHRSIVGTTIGKDKEPFSDLDFADDVALLAEMLSVLVLALEVMDTEAQPLGMSINWTKTKIQDLGGCDAPC